MEPRGWAQLCSSLGFLLSTSSHRGQTGIITPAAIVGGPWRVSVFLTVAKLSPFTGRREPPLADSWQLAQRGHSPRRKERRAPPRKRSSQCLDGDAVGALSTLVCVQMSMSWLQSWSWSHQKKLIFPSLLWEEFLLPFMVPGWSPSELEQGLTYRGRMLTPPLYQPSRNKLLAEQIFTVIRLTAEAGGALQHANRWRAVFGSRFSLMVKLRLTCNRCLDGMTDRKSFFRRSTRGLIQWPDQPARRLKVTSKRRTASSLA